ncbi:ComEC/Rec2 family competence protein, partial [Candidatus Daviesbacteria bacterium]|nr:ComEC/Rec2 family competence protein [Candidatus Daviesbacteria bacterium]
MLLLFTKVILKWNKLPIFLSVVLFLLIFFIRLQQGGWEISLDLFKRKRLVLDQKISQFLPSPQAELLSGILLGQNKNLPVKLKLNLRDTSTLHIVVASGQNLSMVGGLFLAMAGLIKRRNAIFLSLLAVTLYTLLSGVQVPILRAAIMFSLASLASIYGRVKDSIWILIITLSVMLLINPLWIKDLSFQLSALATIGVVVVAPVLLQYLRFLPLLGQDLSVTIGAQLMVIPIIIQNFHQLSLVSILTNLLVGWTIPFIMILGGLMLMASFIWSGLAWILGLATVVILTYFIYIVGFFAALPFAWEYVGEQTWVVWVGYYILLTGVLLVLIKSNIKN